MGSTNDTCIAEDWHGNDYPDEEVESDDEYGQGAYNYRQAASDDEEFDNDAASWSGEDSDAEKTWKKEFKLS